MATEALAILSGGSHTMADPRSPQLTVLDLAATRGDGIFETLSIGHGAPQAFDAHLARFARSAAKLDLPVPDDAAYRAAILAVAAELADAQEAWVKIVLSRGIEGGDVPTGWAYGTVATDHTADRTVGIRVVLLDRGVRHDVAETSPWLLAGAKTLSYAVNKAAGREAARRGADDALFVSSDGFLLEGPTANLLLRRGDALLTPRVDQGILAGTTQGDLFTFAEARGMATSQELLRPEDLTAADAAWLVSSVRHAAPIRAVDGTERSIDRELSDAMNAFLRARTS